MRLLWKSSTSPRIATELRWGSQISSGLPLTSNMARKRLLEPIHPGKILFEEFIKPMDISINRLAREIHVSPGRISAIVNGKRAITADTALRLSRYLGTSSDLWIGLQGEFDLRVAKRTIGPEIERHIQQHVA